MFFLLQEEVCYNYTKQKEEPLALQKIMMKDLNNLSFVKTLYLTESRFFGLEIEEVDKFME